MFYYFQMKCVVQQAVFICTPDYKQTLLLKRGAHKTMAGLHTGIGGHVDNHELEEIESCVYRELEEETGITRDDIYDLKYRATILHSVQDKGDWVMYCYTALTDKASELPLHTPDGELLRYDTDKLESLALTSLTKLCHDKIFASEAPRFVGGMRHHDCEGKCCMVYE